MCLLFIVNISHIITFYIINDEGDVHSKLTFSTVLHVGPVGEHVHFLLIKLNMNLRLHNVCVALNTALMLCSFWFMLMQSM